MRYDQAAAAATRLPLQQLQLCAFGYRDRRWRRRDGIDEIIKIERSRARSPHTNSCPYLPKQLA